MNLSARIAAALLASTVAIAAASAAPTRPATTRKPAAGASASARPAGKPSGAAALALNTTRQKVSYVVGTDVAQSLTPVAPDIDMAAFERAIRNAFAGQKPLLADDRAKGVAASLMQRIAARRTPPAAGTKVPDVSKQDVGYLVGADIGRSLAPIKDEIDLPLVLQAISSSFAGREPVLDEATRTSVRDTFVHDLQARQNARKAAQAGTNREAGEKFLAENKTRTGVFTTPSGLQYMVLRQGSGARPRATDKVRVNYRGTLLDGTVFDSSYDRGQPVEFMLSQVIAGWTEGVAMMPIGAKYRFWVPAALGYGDKGAGEQIGPNSTLVFDVELLAIPQ